MKTHLRNKFHVSRAVPAPRQYIIELIFSLSIYVYPSESLITTTSLR